MQQFYMSRYASGSHRLRPPLGQILLAYVTELTMASDTAQLLMLTSNSYECLHHLLLHVMSLKPGNIYGGAQPLLSSHVAAKWQQGPPYHAKSRPCTYAAYFCCGLASMPSQLGDRQRAANGLMCRLLKRAPYVTQYQVLTVAAADS